MAGVTLADEIWERYRETGNLNVLREELLTHPYYSKPTSFEDSVLSLAVDYIDVPAADLLLSLGESPNLPSELGFSALHSIVDSASEHGRKAEARRPQVLRLLALLLDRGANPNVYGADGTPLHRAVGWGDLECIRLLVARSADIDARGIVDGNYTPLLYAIGCGQVNAAKLLLEMGADSSLCTEVGMVEEPGKSPEQLALERNDKAGHEILALLKKGGMGEAVLKSTD